MKRRTYSDDWDFFRYTPKPAREVTGGLRTRSQSGSFSRTWWGKQWISALESSDIGARLTRGRAYARRGQVADLLTENGVVRATVQGSRRTPYRISIRLRQWSSADISGLCTALLRAPDLTARLLMHEIPAELVTFFHDLHLPFLPVDSRDLQTECSCPDWSNPCKHIAAVHYLLAEALDGDPFLLFELRGLRRENMFARLLPNIDADADVALEDNPPEPLPDKVDQFWQSVHPMQSAHPAGSPPVPDPRTPMQPAVAAAIPLRLGSPPFWRSLTPFQTEMTRLYRVASDVSLLCLLTDDDVEDGDE